MAVDPLEHRPFRVPIACPPPPVFQIIFSGQPLSILPDLIPRVLGGQRHSYEACGHWYLSSTRIRAVRFT